MNDLPSSPDANSTANIFPTITYSESTSERSSSPMTTLSSSSPLRPHGGQANFQTFLEAGSKPKDTNFRTMTNPRLQILHTSLPPKTSRPNTLVLNSVHRRTISALPNFGKDLENLSPMEFKSFPSDTDESISSPQVTTPTDNTTILNESIRLKIGHIKVRVKYLYMSNSLQIDLMKNFQLPHQMKYKESDLYTKLVLLSKQGKIRRSKSLNNDHKNPAIASFDHQINISDLSKASMVLSLCKLLDTADQGMLIGSATIKFQSIGINETLDKDFDSGIIEIALRDSAPHQLLDCGGYLELSITHKVYHKELLLSNLIITDIDLNNVQLEPNQSSAIKDSSRPKGGERRILGELNLDQWWPKEELIHLSKTQSTWKLNMRIPLH